MDIIEFAEIRNVPILKAGTHHSRNAGALTITEDDLDEILEGSNALKELIKESLSTGTYRGNNVKAHTMPGLMNLHHNDILDETIKERVKGVDVTFGKQVINGETWLTETFKNVPSDIAKAVKTHFPFRSVELLPLTNPDTGKTYKHVVRSTAFLDRFTPPAVKGQTPDVQVEFLEGADSPVTVLLCEGAITNQQQEEQPMEDKVKDAPETSAVFASELAEKEAKIKELMRKTEEDAARVAELQAAQQQAAEAVAKLQANQDRSEVKEFLQNLKLRPVKGANGATFAVSPAFLQIAEPLVSGTSRNAVVMLADGEKPARSVIMDALEKVVEMAAKGVILVELSTVGSVPEQDAEKATLDALVAQKRKENPALSYNEAWQQAAKETGEFEYKGGK